MTALGYGGTFVAFTFLAPILQDITGFSEGSVSLILMLYGSPLRRQYCRGPDRQPESGQGADRPLLSSGDRAGRLFLHGFLAGPYLVTLAALGFLSLQTCRVSSSMLCRWLGHRPGAVDVASALNIAAFNLGIALGAWLGGLVVDLRWVWRQPLGLGVSSLPAPLADCLERRARSQAAPGAARGG